MSTATVARGVQTCHGAGVPSPGPIDVPYFAFSVHRIASTLTVGLMRTDHSRSRVWVARLTNVSQSRGPVTIAVTCVAVMLSGCTGAPSESELAHAKQVATDTQARKDTIKQLKDQTAAAEIAATHAAAAKTAAMAKTPAARASAAREGAAAKAVAARAARAKKAAVVKVRW